MPLLSALRPSSAWLRHLRAVSFCTLAMLISLHVAYAQAILSPAPTNVGTAAVGRQVSASIQFSIPASMTLGTPLVLTTGAPSLDYTLGAGSTCVGSVPVGTCTVNVIFSPLGSGARNGAVLLESQDGAPLVTALVYGTGQSTAATFPGTSPIVIGGKSAHGSAAVAVDGSGNVYVADPDSGSIKEVVAVNGITSFTSEVKRLGGNYAAWGVAVDAAGNVYVADTFNNAVEEIVAVNGVTSSTSVVKMLGSGFSLPAGVAIDGAGNVYVADLSNNAIKEIVAVNGVISANAAINVLGTFFGEPTGVAVDGAGNVFVSDTDGYAVKEIVAVNGSTSGTSAVNMLNALQKAPYGLAVDSLGNVYVANHSDNSVRELLAVGGIVTSASTVNTWSTSFNMPSGVAVDGSGNVYVSDYSSGLIKVLPIAGFAFSSTSTTLTFLQNCIRQGDSLPFTATVARTSGVAGTPTGSITLSTGGSYTLVNGRAAGLIAIAASAVPGTLSVVATYNGDATDTTSLGSKTVTVTASHEPTATSLVLSAASVAQGKSFGFTVTVARTSRLAGTPTGGVMILYSYGGATITTGPYLLLNGVVGGSIYLPTDTPTGPLSITARYGGDANDAGSQSSQSLTVMASNPSATSTTLSFSPSSVMQGNSISWKATVVRTSGPAGTATGSITLSAGSGGPYPLVNGIATGMIPTGATAIPGTYAVTASYTGDGTDNPSSGTASVNLMAGTSTSLSLSSTSVMQGQSFSFTVAVARTAGQAGVPSGTVTLSSGGTYPLVNGVASGSQTIAVTAAPGNSAIVATYNGDTLDTTSTTSKSIIVTVAQASTSTILTLSPASVVQGNSIMWTATVVRRSLPAGTATGSITLSSGGTYALVNGVATGTIPVAAAAPTGALSIVAVYGGDATDLASTASGSVLVTAAKSRTSTTVALSSGNVVQGGSITFKVTVLRTSGSIGLPTGTVYLSNGLTLPLINGVAAGSFVVSASAPPGFALVTAIYSGDAMDLNSQGFASLTITAAPALTSTALTFSSANVVPGQNVMWTAKVFRTTGPAGTASGAISLSSGGIYPLVNGVATGSLTVPANAQTSILSFIATYSGDAADAVSSGTTSLSVTAPPAATSTTLVLPASVVQGQDVPWTVTVARTSGPSGIPTGTITLLANGNRFFNNGQMLVNGVATGTFPAYLMSVGSFNITATYSGDTADLASTGIRAFVVTAANSTSTVLTLSPGSIVSGQSVSWTARVTRISGVAGTPSGSVVLSSPLNEGLGLSGTYPLVNGVASGSFPISLAAVYKYRVFATYLGNATDATSTGSQTFDVTSRSSGGSGR